MSGVEVDPSELLSVSTQLDSLSQSMQSGLGALDHDVSDALGTSWSGSAAAAYTQVWQEWHEGATLVVEGLRRMSGLLQEAALRYSATDSASGADIAGAGL